MSSSIRTLLETLRDNLATNQGLTDYCNATFSKAQTIFLGYNRQAPPTSEYWPAIVIALVEVVEQKGNRERHRITLGFYAGSDDPTEDSNKITFPGFVDAEELRQKTEQAIIEFQGALGRLEFEGGTMENPLFPLFNSLTTVLIETIIESF